MPELRRGARFVQIVVAMIVAAIISAAIAMPVINKERSRTKFTKIEAVTDILSLAGKIYCQQAQSCQQLSLAQLIQQKIVSQATLTRYGQYQAAGAGSLKIADTGIVTLFASSKDRFQVIVQGDTPTLGDDTFSKLRIAYQSVLDTANSALAADGSQRLVLNLFGR